MIHRKSVPLAIALGFAASLTCASAYADTSQGGGYQEPMEEQQPPVQEQERMERPEPIQPGEEPKGMMEEKEGLESRAGEVGDIGRVDQNRDSLISEGEYKEWRQSLFGRLDADKDGELTEVEYLVIAPVISPLKTNPEELAARYQELDKERTGKVSEQEYIDATEEGFKEADTNNDGEISIEELKTAIQERG